MKQRGRLILYAVVVLAGLIAYPLFGVNVARYAVMAGGTSTANDFIFTITTTTSPQTFTCPFVNGGTYACTITWGDGAVSNGTVNVGGTTAAISNMPPTTAGYVAKTNLVAKTWTVTCN